jgi:hypothetical protein
MISLDRIIGASKRAIFRSLLIACFTGLASQASALTVGDSLTLGLTPGEPASTTDEVSYINFLIDMAPGTSGAGPSSPPNYSRTSNVLCWPTCTDATLTGADTNNTGTSVDLGSGFLYLLAKYNGPNGGDVVWYVDGLTGTVTIPSDLAGNPFCTQGDCGLSHWALYNPGGTTATTQTEVPEPSSLLLIGSGLLMLTGISRKLRSQR